ncbi:MAG: hypothetical protein U0175_26690 [Caldilineaceae bacterium]
MQTNYLFPKFSARKLSLWIAALLAITTLLIPSQASPLLAQSIHPACLNDDGQPVTPSAGAGIGAWMLVLNFNHGLSGSKTLGCRVDVTGVNPLVIRRTLLECTLVNNVGMVKVGNGKAPFDGKFSVSCPGVAAGKQTLESFTLWGRANFANANAAYTLIQHKDVALTASMSVDWHISFTSRYGKNNFTSGDTTTSLLSQTVSFNSAVRSLTGSHSLNQNELGPLATLKPFEFNHDQPITISAPGSIWTLYELIIDPPGGCCKG